MERIIACDQFIGGHSDVAVNTVGEDLHPPGELRAILILAGPLLSGPAAETHASIVGGRQTTCRHPCVQLPELTLR